MVFPFFKIIKSERQRYKDKKHTWPMKWRMYSRAIEMKSITNTTTATAHDGVISNDLSFNLLYGSPLSISLSLYIFRSVCVCICNICRYPSLLFTYKISFYLSFSLQLYSYSYAYFLINIYFSLYISFSLLLKESKKS